MKESEEVQAAGHYIKTIKDPDKRLYAQRYFFYLLGYDLKPPSPRPLKVEEARDLQVELDKFFQSQSSQYSTTVNPRKYWVEINDPGSSSYVRGAVIPYAEFEAERKKILERGGKPPSIKIRHEPPPGNGNGDKKLPATVEAEPVPEKYRELTPFIDLPLPPGADFLPAVVPEVGERKIDVVMRQLKDGVETIQDSAQFRLFLTTMSRFHAYSVGNLILIALQKPEATRVAGFMTWKDLGRWVKKGERGISILAPVMPPKPKVEEVEEEEEVEIIPPTPVYFKVVHVFDIVQTEGKPLPEFEVPVLTGEANEELFNRVMALAKAQGLDISFESRPYEDPSIKGQYLPPKSIWIRPEESRAQQLKSLLHEVAHYYSEGVFRIPRRDAETIAESAAFAVGAHYGFDSGVRSFPYVALWAQDKKVLAQNLNSIRKVADTILLALEGTPPQPVLAETEVPDISLFAKTEGDPRGRVSKFCCRFSDACAPPELLEEGKFLERISWLRHHYKEKHPGMWGKMLPAVEPEVIKKSSWLERLGDCYRLAWRFIIEKKEGWLVHGEVYAGTPLRWIEHAWVELPSDIVYEPVADAFYKKQTFYEGYKAKELSRYTTEEAAIMAARTKNHGPWTEQERKEYLKGKVAAVIPTESTPRPKREGDLEFIPDSPEYLTQTIDASGWREQLEQTFQEAIARVRK